MLVPSDVAYCKRIMVRHGKSYAFATRSFPRHMQDATAVLYAFFRVPDDIVDEGSGTLEEKTAQLTAWKDAWRSTQEGRGTEHPVLRAAHEVWTTYHIPPAYSDAFLHAMTQDLTTTRYETYADLKAYMYGSAAVVGLMMSYVIGFKNAHTLTYAKALGEAMQLTNFLRDIHDDAVQRDRIYLPQEDLRAFHVTEADLRAGKSTPAIQQLLAFEINRARALYAYAEQGIHELSPAGRIPVRVASRCYEAILTNIERARYDVFSQRIHTTVLEKLILFFTVWIHRNDTPSSLGQGLEA